MAETVERLVVNLEADIRSFTKDMRAAQQQFDRNAAAIERRQNAMMNRLNKGFGGSGSALSGLVSRYATWGAAIAATQRLVQRSIEVNDEASASWQRLDDALNGLANTGGPIIASFFDELTEIIKDETREIEKLIALYERLKTFAGVVPPARTSGFPFKDVPVEYNKFDKKTGNWTPTIHGFPASGVTDVTPGQDKELEAALAYADELAKELRQLSADRIENEEETNRKLLEEALEYGEELGRIYRDIAADRIAVEEETQQRLLDDALDYSDDLSKELRDLSADRINAQLEEQAARIAEIGDAFEYLGHAAFQGGDAFERALAGMAQSLALSGLRNIFEGVLGNLAGGGGFFGNLISGARASGGPVSGGGAYLVGEKGPEIFSPSTSGTIIPNAVASRGAGATVINIPIDARGAQAGVAEQIRAIAPAIIAAAVNQSNRGFKANLIKTQRDQL